MALKPNDAFEAPARCGVSHEILFIDAHVQIHVIAPQSYNINLLFGQTVGKGSALKDLSQYGIKIALNAPGHEVGIN